MSENDKKQFDWRSILVTVGLVLAGQLVQWGVMSATLAEHERRIVLIEKRQEEQFLTRDEFEKRHQEMERRTEDNRERIQIIEQDRLAELQKRAK